VLHSPVSFASTLEHFQDAIARERRLAFEADMRTHLIHHPARDITVALDQRVSSTPSFQHIDSVPCNPFFSGSRHGMVVSWRPNVDAALTPVWSGWIVENSIYCQS
jgi:hypothetical protein